MLRKVIIAAIAIMALGAAAIPTDASAYWRGGGWQGGYGGWRGEQWGWGYGGGYAGGAIIGGFLFGPYYLGGGPSYYYPDPGYYYGPPPEDAAAYCMQRFRSYDPRSGTYLGNDGYRHPCP